MLGTVRNVDGTNQPFTIAGLSDGSTDIVHRECNEEYQIPMAVDCQYGAGYLGITDCCKFLFNPTTGVAKVNCIETTVTCVDINNNSNIGSNQPILAQGFDDDNLYDNSVEKTTVVYNANCYLCNDPVTGDPVCKPVLKATTFCADEYLGLPKDYPVKYVNALPVSPDIKDYIYSYDETESLVGKPLKVVRDKYFGAANTKCIVLDGKTVADIGANYTYWTDTDGTSYVSTQDSSYSDSCVVETAFKAGDATNQLLYDIGSGEGGEGSLELSNLPTSGTANLAFIDQYGKIAYCDTGIEACKTNAGDLALKRECITETLSPTVLRRVINCGNLSNTIYQSNNSFNITNNNTTTLVESGVFSNVNCPICAIQRCSSTGAEISSLKAGLHYDSGTSCTYDFEVKSCCSGLCNDLKFNTNIRYGGYGLVYTGRNNNNGAYNIFSIGGGAHSYTETCCAVTNIGGSCTYTLNTYKDEILGYNNRVKTIMSKSVGNSSSPENTYKQLELKTHLNSNTHYSTEEYTCIEMTYKCVQSGNTCFEGKTKYCTTDGKWYVCCDSTKGYKCLLNEDEIPTASVTVNANNDDRWYSLVGTTNHTDLIYSCANGITFDPNAGRIQAVGGFTNDNSVILCVEHTNELNIIPGSGTDTWINYRHGANTVHIGNGAADDGHGNISANRAIADLQGRITLDCGYCANVCAFMPYSGIAGVYGIKEGDWGHFLTFSHGSFDTYYGTAVHVPFWDRDRFGWRTRANGTLCGYHELLDNRGGQRVAGTLCIDVICPAVASGSCGESRIAYTNASFNGFAIHETQDCALYIESRHDWSGDSGGITITNDGVTAFGAGDTDGVFRVVNEDNSAAGAVFKVMKGGEALAGSFHSPYFQGSYGKLDFVTNNRVELSSTAGSGGTVLYGPSCVGHVYIDGSNLYLNGGNGSIINQTTAVFHKSVTFEEPGVKTAMCISVSNGGDDIDFYACCNLGLTTYHCGDMSLYSDYDLCASARCTIRFDAPKISVCNATGDLYWESSNSCGKYQKEPNVYRDLDLNNANWGIVNLASVSNRIILINALLGSYQSVSIATQNCGIISTSGSNTCWTGEVIPVGNGCEAIFNGSIRSGNMTIYGGMYLSCISNMAACGFGLG